MSKRIHQGLFEMWNILPVRSNTASIFLAARRVSWVRILPCFDCKTISTLYRVYGKKTVEMYCQSSICYSSARFSNRSVDLFFAYPMKIHSLLIPWKFVLCLSYENLFFAYPMKIYSLLILWKFILCLSYENSFFAYPMKIYSLLILWKFHIRTLEGVIPLCGKIIYLL